eukprot:4712622-Prymnesium_polylepis.1
MIVFLTTSRISLNPVRPRAHAQASGRRPCDLTGSSGAEPWFRVAPRVVRSHTLSAWSSIALSPHD